MGTQVCNLYLHGNNTCCSQRHAELFALVIPNLYVILKSFCFFIRHDMSVHVWLAPILPVESNVRIRMQSLTWLSWFIKNLNTHFNYTLCFNNFFSNDISFVNKIGSKYTGQPEDLFLHLLTLLCQDRWPVFQESCRYEQNIIKILISLGN